MTVDGELTIGVLSGDPSLPYEYSAGGQFGADEVAAVDRVVAAVDGLPGYRARRLDHHDELIDSLRREPPDLVLNFCDTGYRNRLALEPNIPALLELLEIPYTGASSACMHICADKALVRNLALTSGIPVPNEKYVDLAAEPPALPDLYPAMIKPNAGCGSLGVQPDCVVHDQAAAEACLRRLAEGGWRDALIQDFLTGAEYTVGLVGNPGAGLTVLPPLEIDYSGLDPALPPILTLGSKMDPDSPYWQALRFVPARLDEDARARMVAHASFLFERLGFADYARVDFRAGEDGVPRLIDANFNPTWSWDGKMAMMAEWAGHDYADFLAMILAAARQRYGL